MQDNARPHAALCVTDYLFDVDIQKLDWPARNPAMNPIEHVWNMLKRQVQASRNPPRTLSELKTALVPAWEEISQVEIKNIIQSTLDRMQVVIRSRGRNTHD
ncbi:hypothetical protein B5X24_HaOG203801 [Helicoverpa armigera]|nr:hypothetical protein B5X24_HaOG203801 [Helicoverpa armigera]